MDDMNTIAGGMEALSQFLDTYHRREEILAAQAAAITEGEASLREHQRQHQALAEHSAALEQHVEGLRARLEDLRGEIPAAQLQAVERERQALTIEARHRDQVRAEVQALREESRQLGIEIAELRHGRALAAEMQRQELAEAVVRAQGAA